MWCCQTAILALPDNILVDLAFLLRISLLARFCVPITEFLNFSSTQNIHPVHMCEVMHLFVLFVVINILFIIALYETCARTLRIVCIV